MGEKPGSQRRAAAARGIGHRTAGTLVGLRCRAQLLTGPRATTPAQVVSRLLAVQAQDPRGFRLAIRARTTGVTAFDLERALTLDRSLVVTTLNRGTLHLVDAEDYWWLHALTTPPLFAASARRLVQCGVTPARAERGVSVVTAALADHGPLSRDDLRSHLDRAGVPTAGQALVQVLLLASLRGHIVRGPVVEGRQAWVLVSDWLGAAPKVDLDRAAALLARRYLAGHGPADERDLARWAGITLRQSRAGLSSISSQLVDAGGGLVRLAEDGDAAASLAGENHPPPMLLGPFEPLLLGWADRSPILDDDRALVTTNGIFHPFALVEGRAVAKWGLAAGTLTIRPFEAISPPVVAALTVEAGAVGDYLGLTTPPAVVFEASRRA
jgi:Winged helix DNA-binding domain